MRLWLIAVMLALTTGTAQAGSLRCGSSLVSEGDPINIVLAKCGQPDSREVFPATPTRRSADNRIVPGGPQIEIWTYGPRNGATRRMSFRDGVLNQIQIRFD